MIDIVIPVRPGPNEELRFALRSLINVPHRQVHIVGAAPSWVDRSAVRVFPQPRATQKSDTVAGHLLAACADPEISDPFILFNDDFYVTEPIPAVPALNRGLVVDVLTEFHDRGAASGYVASMVDTRRRLLEHFGVEPLSFELHLPIVVDKGLMEAAIALGEGVQRWHRRTAYGAVAGITGERADDVKVTRPSDRIPAGPFLSTSDASFRWVRPMLRRIFPTPGPYERGTR
ncbi:hypothetical protein [Microbacterium sp. MMO-56]|uniref:hypothetical protein n=1 Tax=Microbacterium sp. MMO-56 TaxID=3081281 RepID=UPI0030177B1E